MSDLINALNRIMAWLEEYSPASASRFKPGLSPKEVEDRISKLPFKVSEEVYELYSWRNGDESYIVQYLDIYGCST